MAPKCYGSRPVTDTMPVTGVRKYASSELGHRRSQYNGHNYIAFGCGSRQIIAVAGGPELRDDAHIDRAEGLLH